MAFAVVNFPAIIMSSSKYRSRHKLLQVRAQGYEDEGKSRHVVDANIQILRGRIEEVKMKERLERCLTCVQGWNYTATTTTSTTFLDGWWDYWIYNIGLHSLPLSYFPAYSFNSLHIILMLLVCANYVLVKLEFAFPLALLYPLRLGYLNPLLMYIHITISLIAVIKNSQATHMAGL